MNFQTVTLKVKTNVFRSLSHQSPENHFNQKIFGESWQARFGDGDGSLSRSLLTHSYTHTHTCQHTYARYTHAHANTHMPDTHTHMPAQSHIISTVHTHTHSQALTLTQTHPNTETQTHWHCFISLAYEDSFFLVHKHTHPHVLTHTHTISFVSPFVSLSFAPTRTDAHTYTKRRQSNSHVFAMCRIPLKPHLQSLHGWETQQKMPRHDRLGRANVKLKRKETTAIHNRMNRAFGGSGAYS